MADLPPEQTAWLDYLLSETAATPDTSAQAAQELLHRMMAELPAPDRLVLSLLDLEERSVKEVSQITGWNGPLVKVRAFRARRRLRQLAASFQRERDEL